MTNKQATIKNQKVFMRKEMMYIIAEWYSSLSSLRFGEALRMIQHELNARNFYAFNPAFPADLKKLIKEFK